MFRHPKDKSLVGVATLFILAGIFVFVYGLMQWIYNVSTLDFPYAMPSSKVVGGLVVCALGYIILELELIRQHKKN